MVRKRTIGQKFLVTLGVVLTVATFSLSGIFAYALSKYNNLSFVGIDGVSASQESVSNWLLVGTDTREGIEKDDENADAFLGKNISGERSDTIIVARVDKNNRTVDLLSVPRDLWVTHEDTNSYGRINTLYERENGRDLLINSVESTLGIDINHYGEVNFISFQNIVDALGGVELCFDNPVRDRRSGLNVENPGCANYDGPNALAFARSRALQTQNDTGKWKTDGSGDFGRTERQRYFLSQLAVSASENVAVTDIGKINNLLDIGGKNLILDSGTSVDDLLSLAKIFSNVNAETVVGHSLPVAELETGDGAQVLILAPEANLKLNIFRNNVTSAPVAISFASADSAAEVIEALSDARMNEIGNSVIPNVKSAIAYPAKYEQTALYLSEVLEIDRLQENSSLEQINLSIGSDFELPE